MILRHTKNLMITGLLASTAALCGYQAHAEDTNLPAWQVSGNAAFKSDYVFRGFSQTDEEPSVQGTIALNHESGFAASLWGSNVDFNDGDEASSELDATASYTDWSLSTSYTWEKVSLGVTYHDTDIDDADCSSLCDQRIVGSLSYSF